MLYFYMFCTNCPHNRMCT